MYIPSSTKRLSFLFSLQQPVACFYLLPTFVDRRSAIENLIHHYPTIVESFTAFVMNFSSIPEMTIVFNQLNFLPRKADKLPRPNSDRKLDLWEKFLSFLTTTKVFRYISSRYLFDKETVANTNINRSRMSARGFLAYSKLAIRLEAGGLSEQSRVMRVMNLSVTNIEEIHVRFHPQNAFMDQGETRCGNGSAKPRGAGMRRVAFSPMATDHAS